MASLRKVWLAGWVWAGLAGSSMGAAAQSPGTGYGPALPPGSRVCTTPWIGPPTATGKTLDEALRKALSDGGAVIVDCRGQGAQFILRAYIIAAFEGTKEIAVSYVVATLTTLEVLGLVQDTGSGWRRAADASS